MSEATPPEEGPEPGPTRNARASAPRRKGAPRRANLQPRSEGPQLEPHEGFTGLARIIKPHGIRGEVRVFAFQAGGPNIQPGKLVYVRGVRRKVNRARYDKEAWILELAGIATRDAAEALRGQLLEAPDAEVKREDPESFFVHELVGLRVVTAAGAEIGTLAEVLSTGANDVYVVKGPRGEVLVPAIAEVVSRIDLPVGVMTITPISGLLDDPQ